MKVNGVDFRQVLLSPDKYNIKAPYSMLPKKITLHNTDNEASAINEINFMNRNNLQVSYHIAVDEKEVIQGLPFDRNGWHCGDGANGYGNRNTIGIEICRNFDRTRRTTNLNEPLRSMYTQAELNAIRYIAQLCIDLGIEANNDNIKTHHDWSAKNCPSKIRNEGRVEQVKAAIIREYKRLTSTTPNKPSNTEHGTLHRVQTGAFSEIENALRYREQVKAQGFETYMVKADNLYKVQTGAYGVFDNAQRKLKAVQSKGIDAFITTAEGTPVNTTEPKPQLKPLSVIVQEVIDGKWGTGVERNNRLTEQGYDAQRVQRAVNEALKPKYEILTVDGAWGPKTTRRLQEVLSTVVDGIISNQNRNSITANISGVRFGTGGSLMVRALQNRINYNGNGYLGANTIRALQRYLGTPVTGSISKTNSSMVKELQRRLNNNRI